MHRHGLGVPGERDASWGEGTPADPGLEVLVRAAVHPEVAAPRAERRHLGRLLDPLAARVVVRTNIAHNDADVLVLPAAHLEADELPADGARAADAHDVARDVVLDLLEVEPEADGSSTTAQPAADFRP